jgi:hypothetical protein
LADGLGMGDERVRLLLDERQEVLTTHLEPVIDETVQVGVVAESLGARDLAFRKERASGAWSACVPTDYHHLTRKMDDNLAEGFSATQADMLALLDLSPG